MLYKFYEWLRKKWFLPLIWNNLLTELTPYFKKSMKVLDIGTGNGFFAKMLLDRIPKLQIIGTDVILQPKTEIEVVQCDGKTTPFVKNNFDLVMIIDVLHHDPHPEMIIKEAARVSRKYILIKDHYWNHWWELPLMKIADYLGNVGTNITMPYKFLKLDEWKKTFKILGLKIKSKKILTSKYQWYWGNHVVYLLEKVRD